METEDKRERESGYNLVRRNDRTNGGKGTRRERRGQKVEECGTKSTSLQRGREKKRPEKSGCDKPLGRRRRRGLSIRVSHGQASLGGSTSDPLFWAVFDYHFLLPLKRSDFLP